MVRTAEQLARTRGVHEDVRFLGQQNGVREKLGQADLFLLPSQLESFGLAALEAMACEVPVIATNTGGLPEVIQNGIDGYLVEPGNVRLAAEYAIELLSRADRGREMGHLARKNARRNFCANDVIPMYERYYEQVLTKGTLVAR
jgi:glycosyltransferase involved in cell wall biosynthesis